MRTTRRRALAVVVASVVSAAALLIAACSGGSSGSSNNSPTQGGQPGADGSTTTQGEGSVTQEPPSDGGFIESDAFCFQRTDNASLTYAFIEQTPPPSYDTATSDYEKQSTYYPGSYFTTRTIDDIAEASAPSASGYKFKKGYFLWANRCAEITGVTAKGDCINAFNTIGNLYTNAPTVTVPGPEGGTVSEELRPMFSSLARANACTTIQAQRVLGVATATIQSAATAAGLTLWDTADRTGLPAKATQVKVNGLNETYLVDYCILEQETESADSDGVLLDYEVVDYRTPAQALAFFQALNTTVTGLGKNMIVFADDFSTAEEQKQNGIDGTNIGQILDTVSGFALSVSSQANAGDPAVNIPPSPRTETPFADYQNQLAVITNEGGAPLTTARKGKVILGVSLFDTQLTEAAQLHTEIGAQAYQGVYLWRNSALQGGSCARTENQVIACLALGTCDGTFRNQ